jgi:SAM-dependent methyltransferase
VYRLIDYGPMLDDRARIDAYRRALAAVITPDTVVLDAGAGVGTFSVLACRLGAARVYAIEASDVIAVAEEVARANGVAERIVFIHGRAEEAELAEQVDVIVSDMAGALPLYEEHLPALVALRERHLKRGGVMIPSSARLFCSPLSSESIYAGITAPWRSVEGVDLAPAEALALQTPHARVVAPEDLAGEPRVWAELDYATLVSPNVSGSVSWQIDKPVHGIALWFESTMHGEITASSGPWSPGSVHATMVLPLLQPLAGRELQLTLEATLAAGHYVVTWHARTDREAGSRQSTFLSEPRSASSLTDRTAVSGASVPERAAFRVSERVLARRVARELLLLDTATGVYHVLNETGAVVWESLEQGERVETIVADVATRYDVDASQASADVEAIVAELREANLIEAVP